MRNDRGQIALSFVLVAGGIFAFVAVTFSLFLLSAIQAAHGSEAANRALAIATGGAEDALVQLVRNKDFSAPAGYTVPYDGGSATVTVTQNEPSSGQATITSIATVSKSERSLAVIVSVSSSTGEISVFSWQKQ